MAAEPFLDRLRRRDEWRLAHALSRADRRLAAAWWALLAARGLLPAAFPVAIGLLIGAVERGSDPTPALALVGAVFVALQVLPPLHQAASATLGDRLSGWLYDQLMLACLGPEGVAH